ncbi:hypothetical protein BCV72DRAFT_223965 [Rhizopus microsporus var. microsporus]|uniref:Chromo domain-containing protein n=2 Tax=Rhizopus microsporus TaxID=58291 RepID=A0A2G4T1S6_RHIZD|nr:uncharacterized protein RHIMIDRAFT_276748 [Rhizopus microsporus ATCC 52813]ORE09195.1 hypothetical protein BCV72DRAFT_223965 [Rhizopus microsporus var. microsporus]PHZ14958.1 hypothetical protein RHIMIDRAFT_276748 [Rhizopus microsporus ATCC 52813]
MDASNTITEKECSKLVDQVLKEDNIIPSKESTNQEKQKNGDNDIIQEFDEANLDKPELAKETIDRDKVIEKEGDDGDKSNEDKVAEDEEDVDMDEERRKQIELDGLLSKALAEGEEEEEEEEEEAEYEIEKIIGHKIFKGKVVQYEIKWKGYPEEENTLEKANTIHNDVFDLCKQYWDSLGVKRPPNAPGYEREGEKEEKKKVKSKKTDLNGESTVLGKRHRSISLDEEEKNDLDPRHVPRCMHEKGYRFPTSYPNENTRWGEEMKNISAVQLSPIDKSIMLTYVDWKNGEKTIHSMKEIHEKCPESLINYYEARLRFV